MVTGSKQAKAAIAVVLSIIIFASAFIIFNFKEVNAATSNTTDVLPPCAIDAWDYTVDKWHACDKLDNGQAGADKYCGCLGYVNASSCYYETKNNRWQWTPKNTTPCYTLDKTTGVGTAVTKIRCNCYDTETDCSDNVDNDCDGDTDKADSDCLGTVPKNKTLNLPIAVDAWCQSGWTYCYFLDKHQTGADTYCQCKGYESAISCYYEWKQTRYKWTLKETGTCYTQGTNEGGGQAVTKIKCRCYTTEINCTDSIDNDCDGNLDSNDTDCEEVNCTDSDTDTYDACDEAGKVISGCDDPCDCNDSVAAINPGATENCTNTIDDDCDGLTDCDDTVDCSADPACEEVECVDNDTDGYNVTGGICGSVDCNDSNEDVYPGATEICNQIDDNCDNIIDNIGGGISIEETGCGCYNGTAPSAENATNEIDDDCDGQLHANETDADNDSFAIYQGDCNDFNPFVNPLAKEICINGIDDNCNGEKDEGCTSGGGGGGSGGGSRSTVTPTSATFTIGNGECEVGESAENACIDCGCPTGKKCVNNACILENPAAAAAARDITPPITPGITAQIAFRPFSLLGMLLVILFATMMAGIGSYYYFHYKPKKQYVKFAGLTKT